MGVSVPLTAGLLRSRDHWRETMWWIKNLFTVARVSLASVYMLLQIRSSGFFFKALSLGVLCMTLRHSSIPINWLMSNWVLLKRQGQYFIGNLAYSLKTFLHTPYDNTVHGTPEDNYNYFHSYFIEKCNRMHLWVNWSVMGHFLETITFLFGS